MSIRVASDRETDRLLSLRASANLPLPPEIALADPAESEFYFRRATFYAAYGLDCHPIVKLLEGRSVATMMSKALSRAQHLDRISHYAAWLGHQSVRIIDLTQPPQGRAGQPPTGSPGGGAADASGTGDPQASPRCRPTDANADVAHRSEP